jgi:hypothetical protein
LEKEIRLLRLKDRNYSSTIEDLEQMFAREDGNSGQDGLYRELQKLNQKFREQGERLEREILEFKKQKGIASSSDELERIKRESKI